MYFESEIYEQTLASNNDYIYKNFISQNKFMEHDICNLISELVEDNTEFLDIGACLGLVSLGVKKLLKNKTIKKYHCFEPNNLLFSMLSFNATIHKDMCLYNFAISDKVSLCNMRFSTYNSGCTYIYKICNDLTDYTHDFQRQYIQNYIDNSNVFIPTLSLDFMIDIFENVSVIKIDVEGFEYQVLKGAENFLKKFKPSIIIEIFDINYEKCNKLLTSYGYSLISQIGEDAEQNYLYKCL